MILTFDPVMHEYRADGIKIPSVTKIVSAIYGPFPCNDPEPADRGTYIHELCFKFLCDGYWPLEIDPDIKGSCQAFEKWINCTHIVFPSPEIIGIKTLFRGYAGTPDIISRNINIDRITIVDIKTGAEKPERDYMQLIGYQSGNKKIVIQNLYLSSNGTYQVKVRKYNAQLWRIFQSQAMILNYTGRY